MTHVDRRGGWPALPTTESADGWFETLEVLHLWTQIVGKIRMTQASWINHSWSVPFYVSPRGLRTSTVPYGNEAFEWTFDMVDHALMLTVSTGEARTIPLSSRSVAAMYAEVLGAMESIGMPVTIHPMPSEIPDATPFPEDTAERTYRPVHAHALWRALLQADRVLTRFRAGYLGKASPVHFFWGSFDLAVTRFSGRTAPPHPGGLPSFPRAVAWEAYSHEVTSCGFWPGNRESPQPIFYAYAYPTPPAYARAEIAPARAEWLEALGEFVLPYEAVMNANDPDAYLLEFLESTHAAAATMLGWDRDALECTGPRGPDWWRNHVQRF